MRKLCAGILVLTLAGCATTREGRSSGQDAAGKEDCTRFEAAARAYGDVFNPVKMQKRAIEDCGRGDLGACVAAPVAIPFTTLVAVFGAPLLFPIFMASDNVYRRGCPQLPGTPSAGGTGSPTQPGGTEPLEP